MYSRVFCNSKIFSAEYAMPQLDPTFFASQIFWLSLVFCLCYIFNAFFLLPQLKSFINKRAQLVSDDLKEAEILLIQARNLEDELRKITNQAKIDANALRNASLKNAQFMINNKLSEINAAFSSYLHAGEEKFRHQQAQIEKEIPNLIADITPRVIEVLLGQHS
ncbi:F-type H+-transporting ATPase subunit b [Alphaproteobacteria bacterium]